MKRTNGRIGRPIDTVHYLTPLRTPFLNFASETRGSGRIRTGKNQTSSGWKDKCKGDTTPPFDYIRKGSSSLKDPTFPFSLFPTNKKSPSKDTTSSFIMEHYAEKKEHDAGGIEVTGVDSLNKETYSEPYTGEEVAPSGGLHRQLKSRHIGKSSLASILTTFFVPRLCGAQSLTRPFVLSLPLSHDFHRWCHRYRFVLGICFCSRKRRTFGSLTWLSYCWIYLLLCHDQFGRDGCL